MRMARYTLALTTMLIVICAAGSFAATDYRVMLKTGEFTPEQTRLSASVAASAVGSHILIQFEGPLSAVDRDRLAANGIELLEYIPHYAYTARLQTTVTASLMSDFGIRWFDRLQPEQKLSPMITASGIGPWAYRGDDRVEFLVVLHSDENTQVWADRFATDLSAEIIDHLPEYGMIEMIVDEMMYFRLSEMDAVLWIEPAMPEPVTHNNAARINTGAEVAQAAPWNLSGSGVVVAEWDGGSVDAFHSDFDDRVIKMDGSANSEHATHVAGTVMGSGVASGGTYRGMAPAATLLSHLWWSSKTEMKNEYAAAITQRGATIATNSWGYGVGDPATVTACENTLGNYVGDNVVIDDIVRGGQGGPISICWSAGNQRSTSSDECGSLGYVYGTIGALSTSKNIITVGAIWSASSSMTSFSSWGPTDDGRLKPDVVGPGCSITSCKLISGYTSKCGTSMSTPAVAGAVALLRERWNSTIGSGVLLPSTVKGILINTADDLGRTGPDFSFGHGRVDIVEAVDKIGDGTPSYVQDSIDTGTSHVYDLTVGGSADRLKVTLVWDDPGGVVTTSLHLINDLDLVLIDPFAVEYRPWVLDPANPSVDATTGDDHLNNVETVEIVNPTAGLWTAVVSGFNVPKGPQAYSLVFTPDSIHTPGGEVAVAAYGADELNADPGSLNVLNFWVSNVGANPDSLRVQITDGALWLQNTIDTVLTLNPYDSAGFSVNVMVPSDADYLATSVVNCNVYSLTNTAAADNSTTAVIANARYEVQLSELPEDTVTSPDTYVFQISATNTGNIVDEIRLVPSGPSGWSFSPSNALLFLNAGHSGQAEFTITVPPEVPHLSENNIYVAASSLGPATDTSIFVLVGDNALFPPSLSAPSEELYSQDRVHSFSWTDPGADSYTLYLATDAGITNISRLYTGLAGPSFTMPDADSLTDGAYFWAVRKFVGSDSSSLQASPHLLVVDNVDPSEGTPTTPADNAYLSNNTPDFTFNNGVTSDPLTTAPERTRVQIAPDVSFTAGVLSVDSIEGRSSWSPASLADGRWYWRLIRFDLAGNASAYSTPVTFIIDTEAPPISTTLLPENGSLVSSDTVAIVWRSGPPVAHEISPERYYLHLSNRPDFIDFNTYQGYVYDTVKVLPTSLLDPGSQYYWRVKAFDSAGHQADYSEAATFNFDLFICGDVDANGELPDIGDLTFLIAYLFSGGDIPDPVEAASVDCNQIIDIGDITRLIGFLFLDGPDLCCE